ASGREPPARVARNRLARLAQNHPAGTLQLGESHGHGSISGGVVVVLLTAIVAAAGAVAVSHVSQQKQSRLGWIQVAHRAPPGRRVRIRGPSRSRMSSGPWLT